MNNYQMHIIVFRLMFPIGWDAFYKYLSSDLLIRTLYIAIVTAIRRKPIYSKVIYIWSLYIQRYKLRDYHENSQKRYVLSCRRCQQIWRHLNIVIECKQLLFRLRDNVDTNKHDGDRPYGSSRNY